VIAIIIVVSFLSLMSFAEFLRFQWGGADQQQRAGGGRRGNGNRANREGERVAPIEGDIDDIIVPDDINPLERFVNNLRAGNEDSIDGDSDSGIHEDVCLPRESDQDKDNLFGINEVQIPIDSSVRDDGQVPLGVNANEDDGNFPPLIPNDEAIYLPPAVEDVDEEEEAFEAFMRAQEEQELEDQQQNPVQIQPGDDGDEMPELFPNPNPPPGGNAPNPRRRDDARFEPQFEPLQPAFADLDGQDDGADMEINVALDELLGFRGPLLSLIRNLLWLLVFNTAYLGIFAFAPFKFGGSMYKLLSTLMTIWPIRSSIPDSVSGVVILWDSLIASMQELDNKSAETNLIYQPAQVAKMSLGYISLSVMIFLLKGIVVVAVRQRGEVATPPEPQEGERIRAQVQFRDFPDDLHLLEEMEREAAEDVENNQSLGKRILGLLECAGAIAKVVILLCIKMLFLPLLLGIWLDWATLSLFEKTWSDRIEYAGTDLFGSVFLHWVTGITFMLLVTVSVLQLREVVHPDILARVIRPQEPQPDLLGNLLQESGGTHTRRVFLSLGIYAALLAIHIWLPARFLLAYNMGKYLPLFQPKFWHFLMPQIQVPLELFTFHLCMLGVLEKYKNNIGEMQHHWLLLIGNYFGMTDQILPREVEQFSLIGTLPVFVENASSTQLDRLSPSNLEDVPSFKIRNADIYPLWNSLLAEANSTKREEWIRSSIHLMDKPEITRFTIGIAPRDGKKVLSSHTYIRLPSSASTRRLVVKTSSDDAASNLLPTSIGPYRLKQGVSPGRQKVSNIEIWGEMVGNPIPRPPEGWDDLGVGGAERHGRWAWGDEKVSDTENSVAVRTPFFQDPAAKKCAKACTLIQLTTKMMFLICISWFATSVVLCAVLNIPLFTGHFAMCLLRVPDDCVHDPLAFAIGVLLLVPIAGAFAKLFAASNNGLLGVFSLLLDWIRSFKPHQTHEKVKTLSTFLLLWLVVCPVLLGFLYCGFFVGISGAGPGWYAHFVNWGTGTLLLNLWAIMCYFQMFSVKFWTDMVMGDIPGNGNDNLNAVPVGERQEGANNPAQNVNRRGNIAQGTDANEVTGSTWQGKDGVIACTVESVKAFASGWEWDKVDKQSLLQDCAIPISKHLAISCAVPVAALAFSIPLLNTLGRQIGVNAIFRTFTIASIVVDSVNSSKGSLNCWFQAAHNIARDDRYLIGEILLNYSRG